MSGVRAALLDHARAILVYTHAMPKLSFTSFPECCRKLLRQLEKEGRGGTRNCEKGHAVGLEQARAVEANAAKATATSATKPSGA